MCTIIHGEGAVCEAEDSHYDTRHVLEHIFVTAPLHSRVPYFLPLFLSLPFPLSPPLPLSFSPSLPLSLSPSVPLNNVNEQVSSLGHGLHIICNNDYNKYDNKNNN